MNDPDLDPDRRTTAPPPILPRIWRHPWANFSAYSLYRPAAGGDWTVLRWSFAAGKPAGDPQVVFAGRQFDARNAIPDSADWPLFRHPDDHPTLVETWL